MSRIRYAILRTPNLPRRQIAQLYCIDTRSSIDAMGKRPCKHDETMPAAATRHHVWTAMEAVLQHRDLQKCPLAWLVRFFSLSIQRRRRCILVRKASLTPSMTCRGKLQLSVAVCDPSGCCQLRRNL